MTDIEKSLNEQSKNEYLEFFCFGKAYSFGNFYDVYSFHKFISIHCIQEQCNKLIWYAVEPVAFLFLIKSKLKSLFMLVGCCQ